MVLLVTRYLFYGKLIIKINKITKHMAIYKTDERQQ